MIDSPDDAASRPVRAALLLAITDTVTGWNLPPAQAAGRLGITQPQLVNLLRGRVDKFGLDALTTLSSRAGLTKPES